MGQLFNDLQDNEAGYFIGSIICINTSSTTAPGDERIFEVVDGQQRLTTLSILLMAIYSKLITMDSSFNKDLEDEEYVDYFSNKNNIGKRLVHKKSFVNKSETEYFKENDKYCYLRVQPSTQNQNYNDYLHILNEIGLIKGNFNSKFCGVRRIYKAYQYFKSLLPETYEELKSLINKINSIKFIHISVSSSSDAFALFESLNNRGVPLSVMDIIKNKLLAILEKRHKTNIETSYQDWQKLLSLLPEYQDQERFLRHYYNAFKVYPEVKIERYNKATKSNLIKIYEEYIKRDAKEIFQELLDKAETYNLFLRSNLNAGDQHERILLELQRIGSSPSYLLLVYLFCLDAPSFKNRESDLFKILEFIQKYYVRRNITDFPGTRDLDTINISVIEECHRKLDSGEKLTSDLIIDILMNGKGKPSGIEKLKEGLEDNLFDYNSGMARYVLAKLDEETHTREYQPDLWARNERGMMVWTVEHILPQGALTSDWINMIADGDKNKAKEIQDKWVHCLGNLTLSGYNSQLSNSPFKVKQDLQKDKKFLGHNINIGYKNRLSLNNLSFEYQGQITNLAEIYEWKVEAIESRNNKIVIEALKLFAFNDEELEWIKTL